MLALQQEARAGVLGMPVHVLAVLLTADISASCWELMRQHSNGVILSLLNIIYLCL